MQSRTFPQPQKPTTSPPTQSFVNPVQKRWLKFRAALVQFLFRTPQEPLDIQLIESGDETLWLVYNPKTKEQLQFTSEEGLRLWLDEHDYM